MADMTQLRMITTKQSSEQKRTNKFRTNSNDTTKADGEKYCTRVEGTRIKFPSRTRID
jgi:chaperone required for assembly of F1-ATPase